MRIIHHRLMERDIRSALEFYENEGGKRLEDRFFDELQSAMTKVSQNPKGYHSIAKGLRRCPLRSFPYHLVYQENERRVRVLVLRHDKRHPRFGLGRR